tara:strand:- start:6 stop:1163 length:1158 start_codon:yes stop_codon:yes gene_type:complete
MGGGYMRPQMYQEGGMSRRAKNILGSSFIRKGVMDAQKSLEEESRQAGKEAGRRSLFGTVGGFLGKYVAPTILAASGLGGVGLLGSAVAKGLGAGAGRYLGEKVGGLTVKDSDVESPTGFLSSSFEDLKDYREGLGEGAFGRALGTGAGAFIASGGGDYLKAVGKSKLGLPTSDKSVMIREDGELVKKMIPSVDTEAILGKAKTPELMQAFKEADLTRKDIESKAMEANQRRILSDEKDLQMMKDEYASNPFKVFGDSNSEQDIQRVTSPSLIGEEYALARDSSNVQKQMEELSRNLGAYIATAEGKMGQAIPDQEIRRNSLFNFNPNISTVGYSQPAVGYDYYNRSGNFPSVNVGDLTVLGGSPIYGMNKGGLINPMSYARRII